MLNVIINLFVYSCKWKFSKLSLGMTSGVTTAIEFFLLQVNAGNV